MRGGSFMPLDALGSGGAFECALVLGSAEIKLSTKSSVNDRVLPLPTGTELAVTEIRIGVPEVGSITAPWSLFFDDVLLEKN